MNYVQPKRDKPTKRQLDMLVNKLEGRRLTAIVRPDGSIKYPRAAGGAAWRAKTELERNGWIVGPYTTGSGNLTEAGRKLAELELLRREAVKQNRAARQNETRA